MAKKAKSKNPVVHPNPPLKVVLRECVAAVRRGVGKKKVSKKARQYWLVNATASIKHQLAQPGAVWSRDRKNVLPVARKMGKVAAVLANGGIILLWAAEAAAEAVQNDPRCPGGPGSGGYCDF